MELQSDVAAPLDAARPPEQRGEPGRGAEPSPLVGNPNARVKVIINPNSGKKGGISTNSATADDVRRALEAAGIHADIFETQAEEDATLLAVEAVDQKYDLVIACGGDGTTDEVAAGLMGSGIPLGIIPLGSANNVARMLHIPFDVAGAVQLLKEGDVRWIDVGCVGNRNFLETAGIGLDAALFPLLNRVDKGAYMTLFEVAKTFIQARPRRMNLVLDGVRFTTRALMVLVGNGPYWGYSIPLMPDAKVNDHRFEVVIFENFHKGEFIRHILTAFFGRGKAIDPATGETRNRRVYHPKLRTYRAATVEISSRRRLPVHADARPVTHTPVTITIDAHKLKVIVGRGEHVTVDQDDE